MHSRNQNGPSCWLSSRDEYNCYKAADMQEIEQMFDYLSDLGVDGHTYPLDTNTNAAKKDMYQAAQFAPGKLLSYARNGRLRSSKELRSG